MRTAKNFTLTLALVAALATPLFAASRDAGRNVPQRDTNIITRVINRVRHILGDFPIVPHPEAPPTTTT